MSAASGTVERVLVLGATGKVGFPLTEDLVADGIEVHAYFDPDTSLRPDPLPGGVVEHHGDFGDTAALAGALAEVEALFLLTTPNVRQIEWQRDIIAAAKEAGVRRIVKLSAFQTAADSPMLMGRWHHDGELALAESGIEHVIVRPQYFMQNLLPALDKALETGVFSFAAEPSTRLGLVDVGDVAAVAAVLLERGGHEGEVLHPTGPEALSFAEMAARLSEALGREIPYVQRPRAQVVADLERRGLPEWHIDDFFVINGEGASAEVTDDVERIAGRAPASFADFLGARLGAVSAGSGS